MSEIGRVLLNEFPLLLYQGPLSHPQVCTGRMEVGAENNNDNLVHYVMTYNFSTIIILKPVSSHSGMCNIQFKSHTKTTDCNASGMVCCKPFLKEKHLSGSSPILVPIYFIHYRKQTEVITALLWFYICKA